MITNSKKLIHKCRDGSCIYEGRGTKGPGDKILYLQIPGSGRLHAVTLEMLGVFAREKGKIEDTNYPRPKYEGRNKLVKFYTDCIRNPDLPIERLLHKYQIIQQVFDFGVTRVKTRGKQHDNYKEWSDAKEDDGLV